MRGKTNKPSDVFKSIDMQSEDLLGRRGKDACWPWKGSYNSKDIPYIKIDKHNYIVYRIVLSLTDPTFNINNPADLVRHTCDNEGVRHDQKCCNPAHLTHGTHKENMIDMVERDRHGMPSHVVRYIKTLLDQVDEQGKPVFTHEEIARRYGVSRQTVTAINNGVKDGKLAQIDEAVRSQKPLSKLRRGEFESVYAGSKQSSVEPNGAQEKDEGTREAEGSPNSNRAIDESSSEE